MCFFFFFFFFFGGGGGGYGRCFYFHFLDVFPLQVECFDESEANKAFKEVTIYSLNYHMRHVILNTNCAVQ